MPQHNMFAEVQGSTNLRNLANLQDINSISEKANGLLASITDDKKRERYIEYFYDKLLLDTITLGAENNVYVKYCETKTVPQGNEKYLIRRWSGLTEHTYPLPEGIPPKSDRMASESFTGTFCSYGRYMEFTDRVDFMLVDPVIAHYTMELGDTAVRLAERLVREELINNAGENYPGGKSFDQLIIGDNIGIADYRLQALKFKRILVKPLTSGKFNIICSPEHIYDLVSDPLVMEYMKITQSGEPYITGKPVNLFDIQFEETMLDDYAYGYTEISNPGEYEKVISGITPTPMLRLVIDGQYYVNVPATSATSYTAPNANIALASGQNYIPAASGIIRKVEGAYIKDGSWIPNKVTWDIKGWVNHLSTNGGNYTLAVESYDADGSLTATTVKLTDLKNLSVDQLPVHRSFMFGKEFIYKTGMDGRMGAKMYVKPLGSAGVLDPINQRQSVGYKIDTLGFNTVRAEAMVQFVFVPKYALDTYQAVKGSWADRYPSGKLSTEPTPNVEKSDAVYSNSNVATHVKEGDWKFTADLNEAN